jgi:hypothetical protein
VATPSKADEAMARFSAHVKASMDGAFEELIAAISLEGGESLVLPDGSVVPEFQDAMIRSVTEALRVAMRGPRGPVN